MLDLSEASRLTNEESSSFLKPSSRFIGEGYLEVDCLILVCLSKTNFNDDKIASQRLYHRLKEVIQSVFNTLTSDEDEWAIYSYIDCILSAHYITHSFAQIICNVCILQNHVKYTFFELARKSSSGEVNGGKEWYENIKSYIHSSCYKFEYQWDIYNPLDIVSKMYPNDTGSNKSVYQAKDFDAFINEHMQLPQFNTSNGREKAKGEGILTLLSHFKKRFKTSIFLHPVQFQFLQWMIVTFIDHIIVNRTIQHNIVQLVPTGRESVPLRNWKFEERIHSCVKQIKQSHLRDEKIAISCADENGSSETCEINMTVDDRIKIRIRLLKTMADPGKNVEKEEDDEKNKSASDEKEDEPSEQMNVNVQLQLLSSANDKNGLKGWDAIERSDMDILQCVISYTVQIYHCILIPYSLARYQEMFEQIYVYCMLQL
ncbi:hypothetical protein RFI_12307, partial [Reticulomyxa filosa]